MSKSRRQESESGAEPGATTADTKSARGARGAKARSAPRLDPELASRLVEKISTRTSQVLTSLGESFDDAVRKALDAREHVLMVRINDETRARLDQLTDAGLFKSRSESAAFMLSEGIRARHDLFERIEDKLNRINDLKDELKRIVREG